MSRFLHLYEESEMPPQLWQQAVQNAIRGKRGQKVLRELREALLALPHKRLIRGYLVHEGEVCVVGALVRSRLESGPVPIPDYYCAKTSVSSLAEMEEALWQWLDLDTMTLEIGEKLGLTQALVCALAVENDEEGPAKETPEQRYERILRWVERNLH